MEEKIEKEQKKIKNKPNKPIELAFLLILTAVISTLLTFSISFSLFKKEYTNDSDFINQVLEQYDFIKNNYYKEYKEEDLVKGAVGGMLEALADPYSTIINDNDSTYNKELNGEFEGIGVQIGLDKDNNIVITAILDDSPASKADIKPGDIVQSIDDFDLKGKSTTEFVEYVANSKNDEFIIRLLRENKKITTKIKKGTITLKSVSSEIIEQNNKKIGYIYISVFALNTHLQFNDAIKELEKQNIDSLIIDVRSNGGGHLSTVTYMLDSLIGATKVLYQTEKDDVIDKIYSSGGKDFDHPIAVLVNKSSASASEILASGLQEQLNAKLVGTTTFGKGTVQELVTSSKGVKYKMTTKKWLTSKGTWINEKGIKPDVEVEMNEKYFETYDRKDDNQLSKAVELLSK